MKYRQYLYLALLLLLLIGCSNNIDLKQELMNMTFTGPFLTADSVTLTNGTFERDVPGDRFYVEMLPEIVYGDLNGDGVTDAAAVITHNYGGSGVFLELEAVLQTADGLKQAASHSLGDRTVLKKLTIADGAIKVDAVVHAEDDPMCCPTKHVAMSFRLQGDSLVELN